MCVRLWPQQSNHGLWPSLRIFLRAGCPSGSVRLSLGADPDPLPEGNSDLRGDTVRNCY
jgi:hypothetical protein